MPMENPFDLALKAIETTRGQVLRAINDSLTQMQRSLDSTLTVLTPFPMLAQDHADSNGSYDLMLEYLKERHITNKRELDHFLGWMWQQGFMMRPTDEQDTDRDPR